MRQQGPNEPVQYYLAVPGMPGAEVALLAARGAILAHRRFRGHPGYARWHAGSMAKVVLRAEVEELTALARAHDGLTIPDLPDVPQLAVFRPRSKNQATFLAHLKLYSGRLAPSLRADWPEAGSLHLPLVLNASVDLSAGKWAAQVAHAVLLLQDTHGATVRWGEWLAAGLPLALLRAAESVLTAALADGRAVGVEDEGRTETAPGTLTVAASAPGSLSRWQGEPGLALSALGAGRPLTAK
jgi:peptidyl-tRNA hydrolase